MGTLIDSSVFIAAERGHPPIGTMLALADFAAGDYLIAAITASELLAATALTHGHDVMMRDLRSFPRVPGLKVLAV